MSISISRRRSSWPLSGHRAAARRRCSDCSRGWTGRRRGASRSTVERSGLLPRMSGRGFARRTSASCSRPSSSFPRSLRWRTCSCRSSCRAAGIPTATRRTRGRRPRGHRHGRRRRSVAPAAARRRHPVGLPVSPRSRRFRRRSRRRHAARRGQRRRSRHLGQRHDGSGARLRARGATLRAAQTLVPRARSRGTPAERGRDHQRALRSLNARFIGPPLRPACGRPCSAR